VGAVDLSSPSSPRAPIIERRPAPLAGSRPREPGTRRPRAVDCEELLAEVDDEHLVGAASRELAEELLAEVDDEHLVGAASRRSPPRPGDERAAGPRADPARGDVSDDRRARAGDRARRDLRRSALALAGSGELADAAAAIGPGSTSLAAARSRAHGVTVTG
jgi:hypothetical protein